VRRLIRVIPMAASFLPHDDPGYFFLQVKKALDFGGKFL